MLISDNVLQGGDIIESHYAVERRNRTIYKRMREYLYELKHNDKLLTSVDAPWETESQFTVQERMMK